MTKAGISPGLFLRVGLIVDVCLGCRREEPGAGHAFLFRSPVDEPEYTGREGHIHAHWLFRLGVDGDELVQGAFRDVDFKFAAVRFGLGLGRSQTGRNRKGRAAIHLDLEPAGGRVLCRFKGFLQRVAEGVATFQIREEYAERAVFLRQKLCDVVVSHTHLEYMGLAGGPPAVDQRSFRPLCFSMLLRVGSGISFFGSGTVVFPGFVGCRKCLWLPGVRGITSIQPSSFSRLMTSLLVIRCLLGSDVY